MSSTEDTSTDVLSERLVGQVKWFNNKAGYGFITVNDGEFSGKDIFIHYSTIHTSNTDQYKYLVQGEYVEFSLMKSNTEGHEYQAVDISGIKGGLLMCESRRMNRVGSFEQSSRIDNPRRRYKDNQSNRVVDDGYQVVRKRRTNGPRKEAPVKHNVSTPSAE
jgi:CspA family cold shock protein